MGVDGRLFLPTLWFGDLLISGFRQDFWSISSISNISTGTYVTYIYICLYLHHDYISLYMSSNLPYFFLACPPPQTPLLFSPRDETIRHPTDVNQTRPLGAHIHKTTELPEVLWGFFRLPWWTVTDPWIWKTQSKYVFNAVKFQLEGPVWKGFFKETREK